MPNNAYNTNFLETPDPVTGLQRRTGQNFLDHKQTLHERLTLEHAFDVDDPGTQPNHGIHRKGSARAYYTVLGDGEPTTRPTGEDKNGDLIPGTTLNTDDVGRLFVSEEREIKVWTGSVWKRIDTTQVGAIMIWPSTNAPDTFYWKKCNGQPLVAADYPALETILGSTGGSIILPNMQGVGVTGSGTLDFPENGDPEGVLTGRIKGDSQILGFYREDQVQEFGGSFAGNEVFDEGNLFNIFSGIFTFFDAGGSGKRTLNRATRQRGQQGVQISLSNGPGDDNYLRHGTHTRGTSIVMDYYIKVQ